MSEKLEVLCWAPRNVGAWVLHPAPLPGLWESGHFRSLPEDWGGQREGFIYTSLSELIIQWLNLPLHLSLDLILLLGKINNELGFH